MCRAHIFGCNTRQIHMQRSRIKKRRPFWPWFILLALIFAGGGYILAANLFSSDDTPVTKSSSSKKSSSSTSSKQESTSSQDAASSAVSSAITVVNEADAASSESVSSVADSSVASSVLTEVTKDATGEKVPTIPAQTSSVTSSAASDSSAASSSEVAAIGNWTKAAYDGVALGSTTYQNIIASYGAPTYLTSDQKYAYAVWQGTNDANVTIVFTPTDSAGTLTASTKSYKGLQ